MWLGKGWGLDGLVSIFYKSFEGEKKYQKEWLGGFFVLAMIPMTYV